MLTTVLLLLLLLLRSLLHQVNVQSALGSGPVYYWESGNTISLTCDAGYAFQLGNSLSSQPVSLTCSPDSQTMYVAPGCSPTPCSSLSALTVVNGALSVTSGVTGDITTVQCADGLVPATALFYTCQGSPGYGGLDWQWGNGQSLDLSQPLQCVAYSTATLQLSVNWLDQYSYNVSWPPLDWSTVQGDLSNVDESALQYNLHVARAFPLSSQLSASNAQESGLLASPFTYVTNSTWVVVQADSMKYIEGINAQLTMTPVVPVSNWIGSPTPTTVIGPCGCDVVNNYDGLPQNVSITQSFDDSNELTITFTPQSLCASQYQLKSNVTGQLQKLNLTNINTPYAANYAACSTLTPYQTPIQQITWQLAGRPQWLCVVPLPMTICEQCVPVYTPQTWNYACQTLTPLYWFNIDGQIESGGSSSTAAGVEGVTVTAVVLDTNSQPLLDAYGLQVSATAVTNVLGKYQMQLRSAGLTQPLYNVSITPSRADPFVLAAPTTFVTAASSAGGSSTTSQQLVNLGVGTSIAYQDGSSQTVTSSVSTALNITFEYVCDPSVFPYRVYNTSGAGGLQVTSQTSPLVVAALQAWNANSTNDPTQPDILDFMIANCPGGTVDNCMPGVPQWVSANASSYNATSNIQTGVGLVPTVGVTCELGNAALVRTVVVVTVTTVVHTTNTLLSGPVGSNSFSQSSSVVGSIAWVTPLQYNATSLQNLTNAQIAQLESIYALTPGQLTALVGGAAPFLVSGMDGGSPVLAGYAVASDGSLARISSLHALSVVVPANWTSTLPLALLNQSSISSGTAPPVTVPAWVLTSSASAASSASVWYTDKQYDTTSPITTPVVYKSTVVTSQLVSVGTASPAIATAQLRVDLASAITLHLPLSGIPPTSLSIVPPSASGDSLTVTNSSVDIVLAVSGAVALVRNVTTGALTNAATISSLSLTITGEAAVVDTSHTASSYVAAASPSPLVATSSPLDVVSPLLPLSYHGVVTHAFQSEGVVRPTGSLTLPVSHAGILSLVNFIDVSVVSVHGNINIGPSAYEWLAGLELCGMPNVVVTAYAIADTQRANPLGYSEATLGDGSFVLTVPIDEPVVLVPSYVSSVSSASINHQFLPPTIELVGSATPVYGVQFYDIQLNTLTLSIAGGLCEASVGSVKPMLILDSCGSAQFIMPPYSKLDTQYQLPAIQGHVLSYAGDPRTGLVFDGANGMTPGYQVQLNTWLLNNAQLVLDLTAGNMTTDFVYYNTTQVGLASPLNVLPCVDWSSTQQPFAIWLQGSTQTVTFYLWEQYGYGEFANANLCQQVSSDVGVYLQDLVSQQSQPPLTCASGCTLPETTFDGKRTTTNYTLVAGSPNVFQRGGLAPDYTLDVLFGIANSLTETGQALHVLVTGNIAQQTMGVVPIAPQSANFILRDPPGGSSYASVSTVTISTFSLTTGVTSNTDSSASNQLGEGAESVESECVGDEVYACNLVGSTNVQAVSGTGTDSSSVSVSQGTTTTTQQVTLTAQTSQDPSVIDGDGDLFLLSTSQMTYTLATVLSANTVSGSTHCNVVAPYPNVVYSQSSVSSLTWYSAGTIRNNIIPNIQSQVSSLLATYATGGAQAGQPWDATNSQTLVTLQTQIIAWNALLEQNDQFKINASPWPELLGGAISWVPARTDASFAKNAAKTFAEEVGLSLLPSPSQLLSAAKSLYAQAAAKLAATQEGAAGAAASVAESDTEEAASIAQNVGQDAEEDGESELSLFEENPDDPVSNLNVNQVDAKLLQEQSDLGSQAEAAAGRQAAEKLLAEAKIATVKQTVSQQLEAAVTAGTTKNTGASLASKYGGAALVMQAIFNTIKKKTASTAGKVINQIIQEVHSQLTTSQSSVSFSGGTGLFTLSMDVTSSQATVTNTAQTNSFSTSLGRDSDIVEVGDHTTITAGQGTNIGKGQEVNNNKQSTSVNTITVHFGDPDLGDLFDVTILKDDVFGTPVYFTSAGQSRCPSEAGTLAREAPSMQWAANYNFNLLNPYEVATAVLQVTSASPTNEPFMYVLNLDESSNVGGLQVSANGVPLGMGTGSSGGVVLTVMPGGSGTFVLISFQRGTGTGYEFGDMLFTLTSLDNDQYPCADPAQTAFIWGASFAQPCSQVSWYGQDAYSPSFTINLAAVTQSDGSIPLVKYAPLSITNPEMSIVGRSWIEMFEYGNLLSGTGLNAPFVAEFLPQGASAAEWELLTGDAALDGGSTVFNPLLASQPGNDYYTWAADVTSMNGYYQFRVRTQCVQPVNGGSDSTLYSFVSPILTGLIDFYNPEVYGSPVPAVGQTWSPGNPITVTFSEQIICTGLGFQVSALAAPSLSQLLAGKNTTTLSASGSCSGSTLSIALTGSPNWQSLSGGYLAVAVVGVEDIAGNPTADTNPITWSFPIATFDATHSTVDVSNLAFFPNTALLLSQVEAARAASSSAAVPPTSGRRLLQVGAPVNSSTSTSSGGANLLSAQLSNEVIQLITLYCVNHSLGATGLTAQSVVVTGITSGTAVAGFSFQYTPAVQGSSVVPLVPSVAASYFSAAMTDSSMLPLLANATLFPMLSQSVQVSNLVNGTYSSTSSQQLQYAVNPINVRVTPPTPVSSTGASTGSGSAPATSISTLTFNTPSYNAIIDFSLSPSATTAQVTWQLTLLPAMGARYDSLTSLLLTYQPIPDPSADPDVVANTLYPLTTVNSSDPSSGKLNVYNELGGAYYAALLAVPTVPGGLNYSVSITDWQGGAAQPFFTQQLFVVGAPQPPSILSVCQPSALSLQIAYLPSEANGQTPMSGNVDMLYQVVVAVQLPGATSALTTLVAPSAVSGSTSASWCHSPAQLVVACSNGFCPPPTAYMTVNLSSVPAAAVSLASQPGTPQLWNVSLYALHNTTLTTSATVQYAANPVVVATLPASVTVSQVVQVALDVLQLTFVLPQSGGAPILSWQIGWQWQGSSPVQLDPAAGSTIGPAMPLPVDGLSSAASKVANSSCLLRIPDLLAGPTLTPFSVFVVAVNAYGAAQRQLHRVALPAFVTSPTQLSITTNTESSALASQSAVYLTQASALNQTQSVTVSWAAPSPSQYYPSASMAVGFRVDVTVNATTLLAANSNGSAVNNTFTVSSTTSSYVTPNTSITLQWPLFGATSVAVSALINSSSNVAKLCTPGAVQAVPSVPVQSTLSASLPQLPSIVNVSQSGAQLTLSWLASQTASDAAFRVWFAPVSAQQVVNGSAAIASPSPTSISSSGPTAVLSVAIPVPLSYSAVGNGTVSTQLLPYAIGLQAGSTVGWGPVQWSSGSGATAAAATGATQYVFPVWGPGLLAVPSAPIVSQITQLTVDATAGTSVVLFTLSAAGVITPGLSFVYSFVGCSSTGGGNYTAASQPAIDTVTLPVPSAVPHSLTTLSPPIALSTQYCIQAYCVNEAGVSVTVLTPLALQTADTFSGSASAEALITAYQVAPGANLNQGVQQSSSATLTGIANLATVVSPVDATIAHVVLTFSLAFLSSSTGSSGSSSGLYESITAVSVSYQPLANSWDDPDVVAETAYPIHTLVSSSAALPVQPYTNTNNTNTIQSAAPAAYFLASPDTSTGEYVLWLANVPSQPGGVHYALSVSDATFGVATSSSTTSSSPLISVSSLFVMGTPAAPQLLSVCQSAPLTVQIAYLPSQANGRTPTWGNVGMQYNVSLLVTAAAPATAINASNNYSSSSSSSSSFFALSVPSAGLSAATSVAACSTAPTSLPCSGGFCPPAVAHLNVDLSSVQPIALALSTPGTSYQCQLSLVAINGQANTASAAITASITLATQPALVRVLRVLQLGLDVFQLTFATPASTGSPITSYVIGYQWQNSTSQILTYDSAAPLTLVSGGVNSTNTTCLLTIPALLSGPTNTSFYVSIQAVNAFGLSPLHLHLAALPVYVPPPTGLTISSVPTAVIASTIAAYYNSTSVYSQTITGMISWTGLSSSQYWPSAAMAMGWQVTIAINASISSINSSSSSSSSALTMQVLTTANTSVAFVWPLYATVKVSVSTLINSSSNVAKLFTPGAVAVVPSQPATSTISTALPFTVPLVTVSQSGSTISVTWPNATQQSSNATFRLWFAATSQLNGTSNSSSIDLAAVTTNPQSLSSSSLVTTLSAPSPISLSSLASAGTVLSYAIGLQAGSTVGWGPVQWSSGSGATAAAATGATQYVFPVWGPGLLAVPSAPIVSQITQLTVDATAGTSVVLFTLSAAGVITPGLSFVYSFVGCSSTGGGNYTAASQPAIDTVTLPVPSAVPHSLTTLSPPIALSTQYCIQAYCVNEAGVSVTVLTPLALQTADTFSGSASAEALITAYQVAPGANLNQGVQQSSSATLTGIANLATVVSPVDATIAHVVLTFSLAFLSSSTGSSGSSSGLYESITAVSVSYQPLANSWDDPDVVAETAYPIHTLVSSSAALPVQPYTNTNNTNTIQSAAPAAYFLASPDTSTGEYVLWLANVPSQPGGVHYALSVSDATFGVATSSSTTSSSPLISVSSLFVMGTPAAPQLLSVCQSAPLTVQIAYLPSQANGRTPTWGNVGMQYNVSLLVTAAAPATAINASNNYSSSSSSSSSFFALSVPSAGLSAATSVAACSTAPTSLPCSGGFCPPAVAHLNVDLSSVQPIALALSTPGTSYQCQLSLVAINGQANTASAAITASITLATQPALVRVLRVLQLGLDVFQLTFATPASTGSPITSYVIGYQWQNSTSQILTYDSAAPLTLVSGGVNSTNTTCLLTIPALLSGPTNTSFYVSIQAVNAFGLSPLHLHLAALPVYVPPPTGLTISSVPTAVIASTIAAYYNSTSVYSQTITGMISWTGLSSSQYWPSAAMAMGWQVTIAINASISSINSSSSSSSSALTMQVLTTANTSVAFVWPLYATVKVSVSTLINSSSNVAKLFTPGAVAVVPSQPATSTISTALPFTVPLVTVSQSGSTISVTWPNATQQSSNATFRLWFAATSQLNGTSNSSSIDLAAVTTNPQSLSSSSLVTTLSAPQPHLAFITRLGRYCAVVCYRSAGWQYCRLGSSAME